MFISVLLSVHHTHYLSDEIGGILQGSDSLVVTQKVLVTGRGSMMPSEESWPANPCRAPFAVSRQRVTVWRTHEQLRLLQQLNNGIGDNLLDVHHDNIYNMKKN